MWSSGSFPGPDPTGSGSSVMIFISSKIIITYSHLFSFLCQLLSSLPGAEETLILSGALSPFDDEDDGGHDTGHGKLFL